MNVDFIIDQKLPVIVSFSGGKDSTAAFLYVLYKTPVPKNQIHVIFMDTGWEHKYTYLQLLRLGEHHPFRILRSSKYPGGMKQLMKERGIPSQRSRFCTQELKIFPARDYLKANFDEFVKVMGIRREEGNTSNKRGQTEEFRISMGTMMWEWNPIFDWTLQDVWDIHEEFGFKRNKLYDLGMKRSGCAPCIFNTKKQLAFYLKDEENL